MEQYYSEYNINTAWVEVNYLVEFQEHKFP